MSPSQLLGGQVHCLRSNILNFFFSPEQQVATVGLKYSVNHVVNRCAATNPGFTIPFLEYRQNQLGSVTQSCPTLWHHGLKDARFPYPSPTPRACTNSCPLSWWFHPTISSSIVPFSYRLQSFPASFPMSQFLTWSGQSTGASATASVLPMNILDWFPLGCTGWISLQSKGLSRVFSNTKD